MNRPLKNPCFDSCFRLPGKGFSHFSSKNFRRRVRGFTLVEVLVALSIVAIALLAGTQATSALTQGVQRQDDVVLAHVCAENALVQARLAGRLPAVGSAEQSCPQAGRDYRVRIHVTPTPNPQMRRVDAQVLSGAQPVLRLSTIVGRY